MVSCTPARWPAAQRRKRVKKRGVHARINVLCVLQRQFGAYRPTIHREISADVLFAVLFDLGDHASSAFHAHAAVKAAVRHLSTQFPVLFLHHVRAVR